MSDIQEPTNPALEDIKDINISRPELTPDEWTIVGKATEWLKATLRPEVRQSLELEYQQKYEDFEKQTTEQTKTLVASTMEEWKKNQEPLSNEEYSTLLAQEYLSFTVYVGEEKKSFVIKELSARAEKRILTSVKENIVPFIEKISAAHWNVNGDLAEEISGIVTALPETLDAAADLVAIILDPKKEDSSINKDWVLDNLNIPRMTNIILAQMEANRYRDFFSNASRTFRNSMRLKT